MVVPMITPCVLRWPVVRLDVRLAIAMITLATDSDPVAVLVAFLGVRLAVSAHVDGRPVVALLCDAIDRSIADIGLEVAKADARAVLLTRAQAPASAHVLSLYQSQPCFKPSLKYWVSIRLLCEFGWPCLIMAMWSFAGSDGDEPL